MLFTVSHLLTLCARVHRGLLAERLQSLGLTSGEDLVLAELWHEDGLTQADLARRLALRRSTVTAVLRTMERRGLVRRVPDDRDGRVLRVHHTEHAATVRKDLQAVWQAAEDELLAGLTPADTAALRELLTRTGRLHRRQ